MKPDRRVFLRGLTAGVCSPVVGGLSASCAAGTRQPASPSALASSGADAPGSLEAGPEEREAGSATSSDGQTLESVPRRAFGRHAETVSVVGLGGHTLKMTSSLDEARNIVARAIDHGIHFFDNAWDYHGGEAEKFMGEALVGQPRDRLFLMSKFCIFHTDQHPPNKAGAMKILEESLRRLKTDHLDLWMLHNVSGDDASRAYQEDSALAALELAKQQGKIRYTGFTGHTDPQIHIDLIRGGFEWDATLMPVSALGALSGRQFEREVMPLCEEKNIAVLGMKGFGGSKRAFLHGKTNVEEIVRYSLSYSQVCSHMIGIDHLEYVDPAIRAAQRTPMTPTERAAHALQLKARGGERYAMYLDESYRQCYRNGRLHPCQMG